MANNDYFSYDFGSVMTLNRTCADFGSEDHCRANTHLLRHPPTGELVPTPVQELTEKALVGKVARHLVKIDNFLVEFAGARQAKFVSKDADRFEAMASAAQALPQTVRRPMHASSYWQRMGQFAAGTHCRA